MSRPLHLIVPSMLAAALLWGCASAPQPDSNPAIEETFREREQQARADEARLQAPERILNDLDKVLDKYAESMMTWGGSKSIDRVRKLETFIGTVAKKNFDTLIAAADQTEFPRNRAIAVAALGFSGRPEALDPLLNAAASDNAEIANNAVFGLAILRDPRTPPDAIARVIDDEAQTAAARAGAAWALYRLQLETTDTTAILAIWREIVGRPIDATDSGVLVSAIRGVGLGRNPEDSALLERYVSHPTPMVRQVAAIGLGRLGNESAVEPLLTLLGSAEANENVRLAANKALSALAGEDRRYDVEEWRKLFDRKS